MHSTHTSNYPTCFLTSGLLVSLLCAAGCPSVGPVMLTEGTDGGSDATTTTGDTGDPLPTSGGGGSDCAEIRGEAREVLKTHCGGCHSGPAAQKFDYVQELDALVANGKVQGGDPEGSLLYQQVDIGAMPKGGPPLDDAAKAKLHDWIGQCTVAQGLPPGPAECVGQNPFISLDKMLDSMLGGINNFNDIDPADQPFIRFFTLTHLWNAGYCDAQLEVRRHALSKLLNSLSSKENVRVPQAVDPERTIYRIDLRDYGWDKDLWELLVDENEFAVQYLEPKAATLQLLTGTSVPFQWGDWFTTDASESPLYDRVLFERVLEVNPDVLNPATPLTRFELEASLGIDVQANIDDELLNDQENLCRAGFQFSGVSEQNRVIERHESVDGAYWLSYDFLTEVDFGDIFYHPLDFEAAGGEIIFNLRNGMQAYLLVNEAGQRVDVADHDIVNNKEEGGDLIKNGRSCMGCHYQGMRLIDDEIRNFVETQIGIFDAVEIEKIKHLYPPVEDFAALLAKDGDTYVSALVKTGSPLLVAGKEVVSVVYHDFEDPYIDEFRAAAELGMTAQALEPNLALLPDGLLKLKIGGKVSRQTMRSQYGIAICNLKIGITKACKPG